MFGNHKPRITGTDEGIWRRIKLIPFEYKIPDEEVRDQSMIFKGFELELNHFADIPGLSGLGSSSAFTVTMINLIHKFNGINLSKKDTARLAINFEQNIL